MRRTRFMTWFFLLLSLILFCSHDFRIALETPLESFIPAGWTGDYGSLEASNKFYAGLRVDAPLPFRIFESWHLASSLESLYTLRRYVSPEQFRQMARASEQQVDAGGLTPPLQESAKEFMAFAALHLPLNGAQEDVCQFTERAVRRDPNLSWLLLHVAYRLKDDWQSPTVNAKFRAWADKLQAWDLDNGAVYLFRAQLIETSSKKDWPSRDAKKTKYLDGLAHEVEWQKAMAEVFARPKFDFYADRRFELEREVLLRQGWNHPVVAASLLNSFVVPGLGSVRDYANLLVLKLGVEAEKAGQSAKATGYYWQAERTGERLRLGSQDLYTGLIGEAIQNTAIDKLSPGLRKSGREQEVATLEYLLKQAKQERSHRFQGSFARWNSSMLQWSMVDLSALLAWVFFILSLASVVYVNAKLFIRRERKGLIYRVVSVAENYLPLLLFVATFGLYVSYTPLAWNFSFTMTTKEFSGDPRFMLDNAIPPFTNAFLIERLAP